MVGLILTGVVAVALWFGRYRLELTPLGSSFPGRVLPAFLGLLAVAALTAFWQPLPGLLVGVFVVAGLAVFAKPMLTTGPFAAVLGAFALPVVVWLAAALGWWPAGDEAADPGGGATVVALAGAGLAALGGFALGRYVFGRIWGPTHPASAVVLDASSITEWIWCGAVTRSSCVIKARPVGRPGTVELLVGTDAAFADARPYAVTETFDRVRTFRIGGLAPATRYHYALRVDGTLDATRAGRFETFPEPGQPVRLAFGACARIGSNGAVFDAIRRQEPTLYTCLGDFHYGDVFVDKVSDYRRVYDIQLGQPGQSELYRCVPIAYVWDDHDYGPNDSNRQAVGRPSAMVAFREYVPHYDLAGDDSAVFQAFSVGSVRLVLTDARSARDPHRETDQGTKSMLGDQQREWLLAELVDAAASHDVVIWVNPVPWVEEAHPTADSWAGYSRERAVIADHVAESGITNLVMVAGDAHMVAIDDGANTNYASTPGPAFPLLHAAALDRPASRKGGPYTHGLVAGGGQFGLVDVEPGGDGSTVVTLTAMNWQEERLLQHQVTLTRMEER